MKSLLYHFSYDDIPQRNIPVPEVLINSDLHPTSVSILEVSFYNICIHVTNENTPVSRKNE